MLKDFLKAYAVAVLVATIITTALWIVGADSGVLQTANAIMLTFGVPIAVIDVRNINYIIGEAK